MPSVKFWKKLGRIGEVHRFLYHHRLGWLVGGLVLIVRNQGRRSGKLYETPLQYERIGGDYYVGSARGRNADWVKNLSVNPAATVLVRRRICPVLAEVVSDPERIADFLRYRLSKHPLMVGLMMGMHHLPMRPTRAQLLGMAPESTLVILHPLEPQL